MTASSKCFIRELKYKTYILFDISINKNISLTISLLNNSLKDFRKNAWRLKTNYYIRARKISCMKVLQKYISTLSHAGVETTKARISAEGSRVRTLLEFLVSLLSIFARIVATFVPMRRNVVNMYHQTCASEKVRISQNDHCKMYHFRLFSLLPG